MDTSSQPLLLFFATVIVVAAAAALVAPARGVTRLDRRAWHMRNIAVALMGLSQAGNILVPDWWSLPVMAAFLVAGLCCLLAWLRLRRAAMHESTFWRTGSDGERT